MCCRVIAREVGYSHCLVVLHNTHRQTYCSVSSFVTMIMESKTPHKVPAISTSEDSQETRHSPSSLNYRNGSTTENKTESNHSVADKDESRDMGETRRVVYKPAMHRDNMSPSSSESNGVSGCVAVAATVSQVAVGGRDISNENNVTRNKDTRTTSGHAVDTDPMTIDSVDNQAKNATIETKGTPHHYSLLPSPSASFDPLVDSQAWSHTVDHNGGNAALSREKQTPKPKHRRSPATTVRSRLGFSDICCTFPANSTHFMCFHLLHYTVPSSQSQV